jgi:hypothetical protein
MATIATQPSPRMAFTPFKQFIYLFVLTVAAQTLHKEGPPGQSGDE